MALKQYQIEILPNTLYEVNILGGVSGIGNQINPNIEIIGAADIYGSQSLPDNAPSDMFKTRTDFTGIEPFAVIPNYLYIDGSPDSIVLTGVEVKIVE